VKAVKTDELTPLYSVFSNWEWHGDNVDSYKSVLSSLDIHLSVSEKQAFLANTVIEFANQDLSLLERSIQRRKAFLAAFDSETDVHIEKFEELLANTMSLPIDSVKVLLSIPDIEKPFVKITENHESLVRWLIHPEALLDKNMREYYKKLIYSSDKLKEAYNRVKEKIVQEQDLELFEVLYKAGIEDHQIDQMIEDCLSFIKSLGN
jgi:hypothetical protein